MLLVDSGPVKPSADSSGVIILHSTPYFAIAPCNTLTGNLSLLQPDFYAEEVHYSSLHVRLPWHTCIINILTSTSGMLASRSYNTSAHSSTAIMLVMQLLIWFVNSNVANAFSTGVIGFLSGPLFPGTLRMANDVLPTDVHLVSMAIM